MKKKVSSHPPSTICLFPISPSLSLPLQTLRLVSLVSLIAKTKRIAERSDTNCDTHTHTHTDRQSTLDKYMIYMKLVISEHELVHRAKGVHSLKALSAKIYLITNGLGGRQALMFPEL
jgi:hypothetical protein